MRLKPKQYEQIDFDSDEANAEAVRVLREKKSLHDIYVETYQEMMESKKKYLVTGGKTLEIGSGGGFIKDLFPDIITSDVKPMADVDMVFSAEKLPFADHSLAAILGVHVIHHIPDIQQFFREADRALAVGGGLVCVEPYWGPVARFVYKHMHVEPFDENAADWSLKSNWPMSGSNQAMSYLLLKRDKEKFQRLFPNFHLVYQRPFGFIRYMATGGIWLPPKLPAWAFPVLKGFEWLIRPLMPLLAIHHIFVVKKVA